MKAIDKFPVESLLPKKETGVTSYLTKYPDYNGKGVVIAILDSGVDPGVEGLQKTPDGKVKVIERFDCSGCGDVSMTTIVQPENGFITGLSGRKLKLPNGWNNPTNSYRVGIKNGYDLYPERLRERMCEEMREQTWDSQHKLALAEASRKATVEVAFGASVTDEDKLEKENLDSLVDFLTTSNKKYTDYGSFYDCVTFHDGEKWMACVDTSQEGDLASCHLLGEYSITHDFAPLNFKDQLNFSINVHDDGNILELVGLCSSHGTHVASISSAYFETEPEKNGIAPGAQIVSLTIGDGRLGSMETGTALIRAMIKIMELKKRLPIDVINMSYGEHAHWTNAGRVGELMKEVINKYEVIWVASAGNHGPALSTIGTPPDINQEILIGVGAFIFPDMMEAEYAMRTKLPGMPFTWSSRGPTIEGGVGVTVCAPGGAITCVPNFTLRRSQLLNGTSMAAPHVAGAVAILVSGLKQKGLKCSPYSMKRALENGASYMPEVDPFAQGSGLLNVEKSFQLLVEHHDIPEKNVRFHVSCGVNNSKGIYIRNKVFNNHQEISISVEPFFLETDISPRTKIDFNLRLALICKEPYVLCPKYLDISNMARVFGVKIDMSAAKSLNTTFIEAYDADCVEKGCVFKIPVTVIKPLDVNPPNYSISETGVTFEANTIKRTFITVPDLATWAVIRLRSLGTDDFGKFVIHCMHILPKQNCKTLELNKHITVGPNNESVLNLQVRGGATLEVVLAKYWANIGRIEVDYSISFFGIKPNQYSITMQAADGIQPVEVTSLQGEEIQPNITLKNAVQILRPADSKIIPLTARDVIPPGRQIYELNLTYNFHLNKSTEVTPNCPILSDMLYESEFESQLWMIFDCNKQFLGCGDAYPCKYNLKLEKGDYVIKMHIRHDKKEYLEKLGDVTLLLSQKLSSVIGLDVYSSYTQAVINGKKAAIGHSSSSVTVPLYIGLLANDKYNSKNNNPAHYLSGAITYAKDELGKRVDSYNFKYILAEPSRKVTKTPEKNKLTKADEYKEALRELKLSWLSKMDTSAAAESLYAEIQKEFPDCLQAHTAYLAHLEPMDVKHQLPILSKKDVLAQNTEQIKKIIGIADGTIDKINQQTLQVNLAIKSDLRPDAAQIKTCMEKQKVVLIDCLCRKGIGHARLYLQGNKEDTEQLENVSNVWKNIARYVDASDMKNHPLNVLMFTAWFSTVHGHHGKLLKVLQKLNEEKPLREVDEKLAEVFYELKWNHLVGLASRQALAKYPVGYRPF